MKIKTLFILSLCILIAACSGNKNRAPVIERSSQMNNKIKSATNSRYADKDWRPDFHVVKKGDTLYSIGLEYGYDYKEIAQLNQIEAPYVIRLGQSLKLKDHKTVQEKSASKPQEDDEVITKPLNMDGQVPSNEISEQTTNSPNAVRKPSNIQSIAFGTNDEISEWVWPTQGKITNAFGDGVNVKGIDIEGKLGQDINSAGAGKVIYKGSDLRGYGNLVIIKHNKDYLSVYAHNNKILVKEGQQIIKGQKIAEMGNSGADKVKLHFEIRYKGKSVDPTKFLGNLSP